MGSVTPGWSYFFHQSKRL